MKKEIALFGLLIPACYLQAQNTYPATGNVGLGIASPTEQLHMSQNLFINGGNNGVRFQNGAGYSFWIYPSAAGILTIGGVGTTPTPGAININNSANIGIGTTAPASKLHLMNTAQVANSPGTVIIGPVDGANLRLGYNTDYSWIQGHGAKPLYINDAGNNLILNRTGGNVGIGTSTPSGLLHIQGTGATLHLTTPDPTQNSSAAAFRGNNATWLMGYTGATGQEELSIGTRDGTGSRTLLLAAGGLERMRILANGNVLIAKTTQANTSYKLDINGIVRANKIVVNTTGADFVFEKGYHLPSLDSVEQFVKSNHHLPGIAPAADMQKEGMEIGEQQTKLLQKIEELTLYLIEQNKKIEQQHNRLQQQENMLSEQAKQIQQLLRSQNRN